MDITIRKATREDAPFIAWGVAEAMGLEIAMEYGGDKFMEAFTEAAEADDTQYSHCNALIACADGEPAGVVVRYDGGKLDELRSNTLAIILRYNPGFTVSGDETEAGEVYIDSLSVLPEFRGKGVGRKLLRAVADDAFASGNSRLGLLVDYDNPGAERLYRSIGFQSAGIKPFCGHMMRHLQYTKK